MPKWEYNQQLLTRNGEKWKCGDNIGSFVEQLDRMGLNSWELVSIVPDECDQRKNDTTGEREETVWRYRAVFKRELT